MKKSDRKQIKQLVGAAVSKILESLKISKPSKSTTKAIFKVSKALVKDLKKEYKKEIKKASANKDIPKKKVTAKKEA